MDKITKEQRSEIMRKIKSTDTKMEVLFSKALSKSVFKFKKNVATRIGKPDIAFPKQRIVVFIDSCFWHGCRYHLRLPKTNKKYWTNKIARNKSRDKKVNSYYKKESWTVVRIWEHSIKKSMGVAVKGITDKLKLL